MLFADLRGWTNFVDAVEPEELMQVLEEFHQTVGRLVQRFDATVGFLEGTASSCSSTIHMRSPTRRSGRYDSRCAPRGDGEAHAGMAEARLRPRSRRRGRARPRDVRRGRLRGAFDYAAIGAVTNLAARLADEAAAGQVLISQRLLADIDEDVEVEPVGELTLKGFRHRSRRSTFSLRERAAQTPAATGPGSRRLEGLRGFAGELLPQRRRVQRLLAGTEST